MIIIQLAEIRGNIGSKNLNSNWFTFIPKDPNICKKHRLYNPGSIIFIFNSIKDQNNCIKYLYSKFARFCLSYNKISANINNITISSVPYIIEDIDYYKYFNLTEEEIDYIESFIK